jgi:ketosteroid isomerase-like protein
VHHPNELVGRSNQKEEKYMAQQDDEIHIRALMRKILRAFHEHDVAALDCVLADDFTFSDPGGAVRSKQQWIEDIAKGNLVLRFD